VVDGSAGTAIDHRDTAGRTPLHLAAEHNSVECMRLLLRAGADPAAKNQAGASCLEIAICNGCVDGVAVLLATAPLGSLLQGDTDFLPVCAAVCWKPPGNPLGASIDERRTVASALAMLLLIAGGSPLERRSGVPLLLLAAEAGLTDVVEALLLRGVPADITATAVTTTAVGGSGRCSDDGIQALHVAGSPRVVRALVGAGADVNARDNTAGRTPLHCCEEVSVARALVLAGADATLRDNHGHGWSGQRAWIDPDTQQVLHEAALLAAQRWLPTTVHMPLFSPICRLGCFALLLAVQRHCLRATGGVLVWDELLLILRQCTISQLLAVGRCYTAAAIDAASITDLQGGNTQAGV